MPDQQSRVMVLYRVDVYGVDARGQETLDRLAEHGISQGDLRSIRAKVEVDCDEAARVMKSSTAAFLAGHGAAFQSGSLPPSRDWHLLFVPFHRTVHAVRRSHYMAASFTEAQIARMVMRGEDILPLMGEDGLVDMYEVVQSWGTMRKDVLEDCLRLLVYTGRIGALATLDNYDYEVHTLGLAYNSAADTV